MDITATTFNLPIRNSPTPNNTPMSSPKPSASDLTVWQAKTLQHRPDRTPLPDAPDVRPWLEIKPTQLKRAIKRSYDNYRKRAAREANEKKNEEPKRTSRKVWVKEEIEQLAGMRERGCSWDEIQVSSPMILNIVLGERLLIPEHADQEQGVFHWRSGEAIRQVWWKYKYRKNKLYCDKLSSTMESELDMDVKKEAFSDTGKVKWNFKRKS